MNKHTPGPWHAASTHIAQNDGGVIAAVTAYAKPTPRQLADARLIAAAPDLLEALEKCLAVLKHFPLNEHDMSNEAFAACAARIAIEKATGIEQ